jgi:spore coat protein A
MISRRQFLKAGVATAAVASVGDFLSPRSAHAFYQSPGIPLFKTTLRSVGPGNIPVALPDSSPAPVTGVTHYTMRVVEYQDQILPISSGLGPTVLRGYTPTNGLGGNITPTHLGGIILGKKGVPIQITFRNQMILPNHIIPVDTTIPGANQDTRRTAVHLHGGLVPWISDGGPFDWFGPFGTHGLSFLNNKVLNPFALPGSAEYYYPLNQSARFMWYHDHAVGITRVNAYAGIASGMLIRDDFEASLINRGLPNYIEAGGNELPIVIQDKIFVGKGIRQADPLWSSMVSPLATRPGSLWYAHTYEPNQANGTGRWDLGQGGLPLPDPSCIPEFFGDTMLVNGTVFPQATVQARRYRLRLLNATNARFLNLQLYIDDGSPNGITLDSSGNPKNDKFVNAATNDSSFLQIGTEGGFLAKTTAVPCSQPFDPNGQDLGSGQVDPSQLLTSLLVAPAERPDLIVDFSNYPGKKVILYNDAPAPFPGGDDRNDYFPGWNVGTGLFGTGNPVNGTTAPGFGPNTRVLMRFNVVPAAGNSDGLLALPQDLSAGIDPTILPTWGWTDLSVLPFPKRLKTLNEYSDEYGRLIQILGNADAPSGSPYDGSAKYLDYPGGPTTVGATEEQVSAGTTEVWEVFNTTGDVHPMHFHLVNVQVINRQVFDGNPSTPSFLGHPIIPPAANEVGWKETVPMYPGTVTRVIMRFDLAPIVDSQGHAITTRARPLIGQLPITNGQPPVSPRTGGHEYVWHCHILEHEEHDMMHALVVNP